MTSRFNHSLAEEMQKRRDEEKLRPFVRQADELNRMLGRVKADLDFWTLTETEAREMNPHLYRYIRFVKKRRKAAASDLDYLTMELVKAKKKIEELRNLL